MAIAVVQSKTASGTAASATVSGVTSTTAGNLLFFVIFTGNSSATNTFSMPAGWVQVGSTVPDTQWVGLTSAVWVYPNNPGGITSVTCTINAAVGGWDAQVIEVSGAATTSPVDVNNEVTTTPTTSGGTVSVTTTVASDFVLAFIGINSTQGGVATVTQPGGWTPIASVSDTSAWGQAITAYNTAATAGAVSYSPTWSVADDAMLWLIAVKPAASGGGGTVAGAGTLVGNATLAEAGTPAVALVNASTPVVAQSALTFPAAQIIVAHGVTLAAQSTLALTGAQTIISTQSAVVASAALTEAQPALVIAHGVTLAGNSVIVASTVAPPAYLVASAALTVTATIITPATLSSAATLASAHAQLVTPSAAVVAQALIAEAAQIIQARAATVQANAVMTVLPARPTHPPSGVSVALNASSVPSGVTVAISTPSGVAVAVGAGASGGPSGVAVVEG